MVCPMHLRQVYLKFQLAGERAALYSVKFTADSVAGITTFDILPALKSEDSEETQC